MAFQDGTQFELEMWARIIYSVNIDILIERAGSENGFLGGEFDIGDTSLSMFPVKHFLHIHEILEIRILYSWFRKFY